MYTSGLSPLARGTLKHHFVCGFCWRFIPAGAGNTAAAALAVASATVYPRWRGEHANCVTRYRRSRGLSPLARGTLRRVNGDAGGCRFIPAGAGNTRISAIHGPGVPVYPRWRGEHTEPASPLSTLCGLSPLARGTRKNDKRQGDHRRFIPAGAGNTQPVFIQRWLLSVYPRWRGEHILFVVSWL